MHSPLFAKSYLIHRVNDELLCNSVTLEISESQLLIYSIMQILSGHETKKKTTYDIELEDINLAKGQTPKTKFLSEGPTIHMFPQSQQRIILVNS